MLRMRFSKEGNAVWISHLDLMRLLMRAFRRAGFSLKHSQGFTPHPELSIALPLSVGVSSVCEFADFELAEGDGTLPERIPASLNAVLPEGVRVRDCYSDGQKLKYLVWLEAELTLVYDGGIPAGAEAAISELFDRAELVIEKHGKKGPVDTDLRPMYHNVRLRRASGTELILNAVCAAQNPTLNPLLLAAAIEKYLPAIRPDFTRCRRLEALDAEENPFR